MPTNSQEYLLEFTSEYGIPEDLHLELPGPEERIVNFPEGKVDMDFESCDRDGGCSRASEFLGTPSTIEKSPLDFANEDPPQTITEKDGPEDQVQEAVASEIPPPGNVSTTGVAPEIGLEEEVAAMGPLVSKRRHKKGNDGGRCECTAQGAKERSCCPLPNTKYPWREIPRFNRIRGGLHLFRTYSAGDSCRCESSKGTAIARDLDSEKSTSFTSLVGSSGSIYQPGWGVTNNCRLDTPDVFQDVVDHIVPPG
ncbi:hypothetical protein Tco_0145736, partial [Tanacetum coccineum]